MASRKRLVLFMPKIALALIVKDDTESSELKRCLNSVAKWVDAIYITGTKNPQKEIKRVCKEYGAQWSWFEWIKDFSAARNFNFSQVPPEYDWILWMDTDDVLHGGENLRRVVEEAENAKVKAVFARYLYQVELDEKGGIKDILIEHLRERLIKNDNTYSWVAPIHETLIARSPAGQTDTQAFIVVHLAPLEAMEKSMYRNIEILEEEVMRNPTDPRPIYYLAKAYFDVRTPELVYEPLGNGADSLTVELLKDYLRKSGWAEERAQAWEYLSMVHRERKEFKLAVVCLLESMAECPKFPSVYIQMALTYVMQRDWDKAMHWIKVATNTETPKTTLVVQPRDYKSMILEALFHIYLNTNNLDMTEKTISDLVDMIPTETNKQRWLDVKDWRKKNNLALYMAKLAQHLKDSGQFDRLRALVNSIPQEVDNVPAMVQLRNDFMPPRIWGGDEVAIFCGAGFEQWSPKSVARGIGGSEEAVINMGRELAKLGWKVTVFADPREDEGEYDGVKYVPHYHINWRDRFNIFVSWRQIQVFDLPLNANKMYLWNHDIQNPLTYTPERVSKIDGVMFLSKWHRQNVPQLDESKVMYTANGINI